jgi:hypothetical protein
MYRIRLPDGSLSVMVNLTRAKDALRQCRRGRQKEGGKKRPPGVLFRQRDGGPSYRSHLRACVPQPPDLLDFFGLPPVAQFF